MVRLKRRAVKQPSIIHSEDDEKSSSSKSESTNKIAKKSSRVAKNIKSSKENKIVPEVSVPAHSTENNLQPNLNTDRILKKRTPRDSHSAEDSNRLNQSSINSRKKHKSQPIKVFIQSQRNVSTISRQLFREIRYLQKTVHTLIPRAVFGKVVREVMGDFGDFRVQTEALKALQDSAELYLTQLFEDAYFCTLHARRKTLYVADINCVRRIRGIKDIINH